MKISELERKQKWVIGVSGGADSMALLDMCVKQNMDIMVAHMNYQKRPTADRDMKGVQAYCEANQIPCIVKYQEKPCVGNFQAFARKERYHFYHELIKQYHLDGVLIAHHLDDHLETYLIQKKRKAIPEYYGIKEDTMLFGCRVVRPLLGYPKHALEQYCEAHHVAYYVDESNLSDAYTRNQIRHHELALMSEAKKQNLHNEIANKNQELQALQRQTQMFLDTWNHSIHSLQGLSSSMFQMVIQTWVFKETNLRISEKEGQSIQELLSSKRNWIRPIKKEYSLRNDYGTLTITKQMDTTYAYVYDTVTYITTPYFTCANEGSSVEAVTLQKDDFPITIRSPLPKDEIVLRFGTKRLNRWFMDRKIPLEMRKTWPVVVNREGKIILVPKIGCDISHFSNNPSLFVIK